jgi:hypothetical protein
MKTKALDVMAPPQMIDLTKATSEPYLNFWAGVQPVKPRFHAWSLITIRVEHDLDEDDQANLRTPLWKQEVLWCIANKREFQLELNGPKILSQDLLIVHKLSKEHGRKLPRLVIWAHFTPRSHPDVRDIRRFWTVVFTLFNVPTTRIHMTLLSVITGIPLKWKSVFDNLLEGLALAKSSPSWEMKFMLELHCDSACFVDLELQVVTEPFLVKGTLGPITLDGLALSRAFRANVDSNAQAAEDGRKTGLRPTKLVLDCQGGIRTLLENPRLFSPEKLQVLKTLGHDRPYGTPNSTKADLDWEFIISIRINLMWPRKAIWYIEVDDIEQANIDYQDQRAALLAQNTNEEDETLDDEERNCTVIDNIRFVEAHMARQRWRSYEPSD